MSMLVTPKKTATFKVDRVPVVHRNKPLMPMKFKRARKYIKDKKGSFRYNSKLGILYLDLYFEPKTKNVQKIYLGVDMGSMFEGFTLISKECVHENIELKHPWKYNNEFLGLISGYRRGSISYNLIIKRINGNLRNYRNTWDRSGKVKNLTLKKYNDRLVPTFRASLEFKKWLVTELLKLYPISKVNVEVVSYHTPHRADFKNKDGTPNEAAFQNAVKFGKAHFTHSMVGKRHFRKFLVSLFGDTNVKLRTGIVTYKIRQRLFTASLGYDPKYKVGKGDNNFYAHCVDSFCIAVMDLDPITQLNLATSKLNKKLRILEKRREFQDKKNGGKRTLFFFKRKSGDKKKYTKFISKKEYDRLKAEGNTNIRIKSPDKFNTKPRYYIVYEPLGHSNRCKVFIEKDNFTDTRDVNNGTSQKCHKYLLDSGLTTSVTINPLRSQGKLVDPHPKHLFRRSTHVPKKDGTYKYGEKPKNYPELVKEWKKRRKNRGTGITKRGIYREVNTGRVITNPNSGECRWIHRCNINKPGSYELLGFRNQYLAIIHDTN